MKTLAVMILDQEDMMLIVMAVGAIAAIAMEVEAPAAAGMGVQVLQVKASGTSRPEGIDNMATGTRDQAIGVISVATGAASQTEKAT
jgi:hypothetical protein